MKTRILTNMTMAPLLAQLAHANATLAELSSLVFELVDPASPAADRETTHVICTFDTDSLLGAAAYDGDAPNEGQVFVDALIAFTAAHPGKMVVTTMFCASSLRVQTFADTIAEVSPRALETTLNAQLIDAARAHPNLLLIDLELLFRRYGEDALLADAFWYAARVRYTPRMFSALAAAITDGLAAAANRARKVLILDLDNTLWGGVVGESGPLGVALAESGAGLAYRELQRAVLALKASGTLLAICSKNNPADVDEIFARNSMMLLRREDFAAIRVGWEPKPDAIADIARTLNLGLDSFVFVDDSPAERAAVSTAFPEVAVPEFPARPEMLRRWFIDDVVRRYFGTYRVTAEDRRKTEQYAANASRGALAQAFDVETFLAGLEIVHTVRIDDPATVIRASQMTQKTNQFNLTTVRCEPSDISRYVEQPDLRLITLEYTDRFGSEGIIALALIDLAAGTIDNIVMSCRVIGRRVEQRLMTEILALMGAAQRDRVRAVFAATPKNAPAANYLPESGFTLVEEVDGRSLYEIRLS